MLVVHNEGKGGKQVGLEGVESDLDRRWERWSLWGSSAEQTMHSDGRVSL